jgi:TonB family protein
VRTRSVFSDEIVQQSDADVILAKLRQDIAAGTQERDTMLATIAEATRSLTGATGAAIAMPRDGAVVCVGRSGETAPELGAPLNVDSGISGECLRTGTILRCDDASRDFHVDAEVCRQLGVQSIAVVPLRGQHSRVGVLEAFSAQSYAFNDHDMDTLGRLAGLAEAAWARGWGTEGLSKAEMTDAEQHTPTFAEEAFPPPVGPAALARIGDLLSTWPHDKLQTDRRWRYGAIGALSVLLLLLLSFLGWTVWYKASIASSKSTQHPSPEAALAERPNVAAGVGLRRKPGAERPVSRPQAAARRVKSAADGEMPNSVIQQKPPNRSNVNTDTSRSTFSVDDVPQVAASSVSSADLRSTLSAVPTLPRLSAPISQGVTGGILQHKVQPVYPAEARRVHLEGDVVLEAMVSVRGQVEDLKVVSGNPLLAQAAIEAVSKWRYTPYLLNGNPVPKQTRITISFIAQQ